MSSWWAGRHEHRTVAAGIVQASETGGQVQDGTGSEVSASAIGEHSAVVDPALGSELPMGLVDASSFGCGNSFSGGSSSSRSNTYNEAVPENMPAKGLGLVGSRDSGFAAQQDGQVPTLGVHQDKLLGQMQPQQMQPQTAQQMQQQQQLALPQQPQQQTSHASLQQQTMPSQRQQQMQQNVFAAQQFVLHQQQQYQYNQQQLQQKQQQQQQSQFHQTQHATPSTYQGQEQPINQQNQHLQMQQQQQVQQMQQQQQYHHQPHVGSGSGSFSGNTHSDYSGQDSMALHNSQAATLSVQVPASAMMDVSQIALPSADMQQDMQQQMHSQEMQQLHLQQQMQQQMQQQQLHQHRQQELQQHSMHQHEQQQDLQQQQQLQQQQLQQQLQQAHDDPSFQHLDVHHRQDGSMNIGNVNLNFGVIVYDLETIHDAERGNYAERGLHECTADEQIEWKSRSQIIEFAAIDVLTGETICVRSRPEFSWNDVKSFAARLFAEDHGHAEIIKDTTLPYFYELWTSEVVPFLWRASRNTGNLSLIAQNGDSFDHYILQKEIQRLDLSMEGCPALVGFDPIRTVKRQFGQNYGSGGMLALRQLYNQYVPQKPDKILKAHQAMDDCVMLLEVIQYWTELAMLLSSEMASQLTPVTETGEDQSGEIANFLSMRFAAPVPILPSPVPLYAQYQNGARPMPPQAGHMVAERSAESPDPYFDGSYDDFGSSQQWSPAAHWTGPSGMQASVGSIQAPVDTNSIQQRVQFSACGVPQASQNGQLLLSTVISPVVAVLPQEQRPSIQPGRDPGSYVATSQAAFSANTQMMMLPASTQEVDGGTEQSVASSFSETPRSTGPYSHEPNRAVATGPDESPDSRSRTVVELEAELMGSQPRRPAAGAAALNHRDVEARLTQPRRGGGIGKDGRMRDVRDIEQMVLQQDYPDAANSASGAQSSEWENEVRPAKGNSRGVGRESRNRQSQDDAKDMVRIQGGSLAEIEADIKTSYRGAKPEGQDQEDPVKSRRAEKASKGEGKDSYWQQAWEEDWDRRSKDGRRKDWQWDESWDRQGSTSKWQQSERDKWPEDDWEWEEDWNTKGSRRQKEKDKDRGEDWNNDRRKGGKGQKGDAKGKEKEKGSEKGEKGVKGAKGKAEKSEKGGNGERWEKVEKREKDSKEVTGKGNSKGSREKYSDSDSDSSRGDRRKKQKKRRDRDRDGRKRDIPENGTVEEDSRQEQKQQSWPQVVTEGEATASQGRGTSNPQKSSQITPEDKEAKRQANLDILDQLRHSKQKGLFTVAALNLEARCTIKGTPLDLGLNLRRAPLLRAPPPPPPLETDDSAQAAAAATPATATMAGTTSVAAGAGSAPQQQATASNTQSIRAEEAASDAQRAKPGSGTGHSEGDAAQAAETHDGDDDEAGGQQRRRKKDRAQQQPPRGKVEGDKGNSTSAVAAGGSQAGSQDGSQGLSQGSSQGTSQGRGQGGGQGGSTGQSSAGFAGNGGNQGRGGWSQQGGFRGGYGGFGGFHGGDWGWGGGYGYGGHAGDYRGHQFHGQAQFTSARWQGQGQGQGRAQAQVAPAPAPAAPKVTEDMGTQRWQ